MIQLKNIKKSVNNIVVFNDISLTVSEGDFFVLCCQNGGGKTTFVKIISGMIRPDSGSVIYNNISKDDIAIVYDEEEYGTMLNTYEYLNFYGKCFGVKEDILERKINYYISKYNFENLKYANFDDLNISSKKMIKLLSVLISDCKIVVLDEPYKHIYDSDFNTFQFLLKEIKKDSTVVVTCNNLDDFIEYATKIAIIDKGNTIINDDAKEALLKYGYKNYLEIYYEGEMDDVSNILYNNDNVKEFTYTDKKIDIVTYDYDKDDEILKELINNNIKIKSFIREEKK